MKRYDAIVIGGGHNGLTCAAYLGKAGKKVLVVEAREKLGGIAYGGTVDGESLPGPAATTASFRTSIIRDLSLESHGLELESRPPVTVVTDGQQSISLSRDVEATAESIAEVSKSDADAYRRFREQVAGFEAVVRAFSDAHPIDLIHLKSEAKLPLLGRAVGIRRLGRERMMELARIAPMCAADWMDEHFESPLLATGITVPGLVQTWSGPRGPGTAANVLLEECRDDVAIAGGAPALIEALQAACKEHGVEIRTGARVVSVVLEGARATGVVVADGDDAEANQVVCAINPRRALLELVPRGVLPARTELRLEQWRCRGTVAHLAARLKDDALLPDGAQRVIAGASLDDVERAFDAIKYRQHSSKPVLDISARGKWLSIRALYAPHEHASGYGDDARADLEQIILARLQAVLPELTGGLEDTRLWTPGDMERELGLPGGQLEHGEMALDQILVRPTPRTVGYRSPVPGLLLASSGSHPGGGISGLPGRLAAAVALRR